MLSSAIITLPTVRYIGKLTTRMERKDGARDPDEQRRIDENKKWRRDHPPEEAWDIDKERDAIRYKRESLESLFRIGEKEALDKMKEQIEELESHIDKEENVNSSKDD